MSGRFDWPSARQRSTRDTPSKTTLPRVWLSETSAQGVGHVEAAAPPCRVE